MKIEQKKITIRELSDGFQDDDEAGVVGYHGLLDIRPPYQREFIYGEKERNAVITTAKKGFPLNVMYWVVRPDGRYEVLDGQQRTISICRFVDGSFAHDMQYFHRMPSDLREKFLDYELMVYFCEGTASEKLDWFETINIAGKPLLPQEIRNAVYEGPWVNDAKKQFSKTNCPAQLRAQNYLNGSAIRQDYLETAIKWACKSSKPDAIKQYMAVHQGDANAAQLWLYFDAIISWIEATFKHSADRKKILQGLDWGTLYDKYGKATLDTKEIEKETVCLMADDEVECRKGIIPFILTRDEHYLQLRTFSEAVRSETYEKQFHRCANPNCPSKGQELALSDMDADHIVPWSKGGKTVKENCQMLCRLCNHRKSAS